MQIKRVLQEKNYNILREEQAKGRNYYVYLYEFDYNYSVDELISKVLDIINSLNASLKNNYNFCGVKSYKAKRTPTENYNQGGRVKHH